MPSFSVRPAVLRVQVCVCATGISRQPERGGKASVWLISQFSHFKEKRIERGLAEITTVTSHHTHKYTHTYTLCVILAVAERRCVRHQVARVIIAAQTSGLIRVSHFLPFLDFGDFVRIYKILVHSSCSFIKTLYIPFRISVLITGYQVLKICPILRLLLGHF